MSPPCSLNNIHPPKPPSSHAQASDIFVCIVDDSKMVSGLGGSKLAMPIEITQFCHLYTLQVGPGSFMGWSAWRVNERPEGGQRFWLFPSSYPPSLPPACPQRLAKLPEVAGCEAKLRMEGAKPYVTDNHNFIVDLYFQNPIKDGHAASRAILALEGVVDHGLFMDMVRGERGGEAQHV